MSKEHPEARPEGGIARLARNRFLRDTTTLQMGSLVVALGNLLGAVALAHVLGAGEQGRFYLAIAVYSFFWFVVNLGLYQVTTSQVAAAAARDDPGKIATWLAFYLKASLLQGLGLGAVGWLVLPALGGAAFDDRSAGTLAAILCCSPLIELPRAVACAGLQGTRRMLALARVESGTEIARAFLVVTGALIDGSALGAVVGMVLASGVGSLLALDAYARESRAGAHLPRLGEVFRRLREVPITHGLPLGVKFGLVRNIDALAVQILPTLILGYFGTTAWVAYMRIAQRLVNVARLFMQGISRTALPVLSELAGSRDVEGLRRVYWRASLFSGLMVSTGVLISLPFLPAFIEWMFPPDYHAPLWTIVKILVPGVMVVSFSVANDTFYLVTNTLGVGILLSLLGMVVNTSVVAVLAWLVPTTGAAWGLCFTFLWSVVHIAYAAWWFGRHRATMPPGVAPEREAESV